MYTLDDVRKEYDRLDNLCGVNTSEITLVELDSVKRLGVCRHKTDRRTGYYVPIKIGISARILNSTEDAFLDVVRHEYAHAVDILRHPTGRGKPHGNSWKAICLEVGCTPKATTPVSEEGKELRKERAKYVITCKCCGNTYYYLKTTKIVKLIQSGGTAFCGRCKGRRFDLKVC